MGLVCTAPCVAQTADPPAGPVVVVKGSAYDPRRDDTATRIVVNQTELQRFGDSNLLDVLRRQPGITVSGGGPGQAAGEIRMRGLGQGYTQILVDGKPPAAGFSIDSLAPAQLERIEILRTATADMSGQAIAGTINLVLRTRAKGRERQLDLKVEGSDVFFSPIAGLRLADKLDRMAYSLNAELRAGHFRQPYVTTDTASDAAGRPQLERSAQVRNNGGFDRLTLTPAATWTREDGDSIGVKGSLQAGRNDSHTESAWTARLGGLPDYVFERTRPEGHSGFGEVKLNWHHGIGAAASLDTEAGVSAGHRHDARNDTGADVRHATTLARDTLDRERERGWSWTGKFNVPLSDAHHVALGWEARADTRRVIHEERDGIAVDAPADPFAADERYRASQRSVALYAQDEWTLSPAWSAYVGVRREALTVASDGNSDEALRRRFHVTSPVLQVRWKLPGAGQNQFRLAVSRTYKAPNTDRLVPLVTRSINNTMVDPDRIGNPALGPELANGLDLAFEHFGKHGGSFSIAPYYRHVDDLIRDDLQWQGGRWTVLPINSGSARAYGVETDAKAPLGKWFDALKRFELRVNAARNWSTLSSVPGPDNRLADQVRYSGTVGLDYTSGGRFSAGASFGLRSGGRLAISPATSTYKTMQRDLDVYGLWRLGPANSIRLSVTNLLAQSSTASSIYNDASGVRESRSVFPFSPIARLAWEHRY